MSQNFMLKYHSDLYIIFAFNVKQRLKMSTIQLNFLETSFTPSLASWIVNIVFQDIVLSRL